MHSIMAEITAGDIVGLLAECKDGNYIFHTHADRNTVKTPLGAFEADEIPNDITAVIKELEEY